MSQNAQWCIKYVSLSLSLSWPNNICSIYLIKRFLIILKYRLMWVKALLLHILGSQIQTLAWWLVSISQSKQMSWSNSNQTAATSLHSLSPTHYSLIIQYYIIQALTLNYTDHKVMYLPFVLGHCEKLLFMFHKFLLFHFILLFLLKIYILYTQCQQDLQNFRVNGMWTWLHKTVDATNNLKAKWSNMWLMEFPNC